MINPAAVLSAEIPGPGNYYHQKHVELLLASYRRLLQKPLLDLSSEPEPGKRVYQAEFALLSHNADGDPLFNYANQTAQELFEYSWSELMGMPSRFSAEEVNRQQREQLLAQVSSQGYIDDYSGVRIAKSGRRFLIRNAVVWNVYDDQGQYYGQAAWFKEWEFLPEPDSVK
jgi:PAS domain-containing protein